MFRSQNDDTTLNLYINYRFYMKHIGPFTRQYPNFVNFNAGEKFLYGRVDEHYAPIKLYSPVYMSSLEASPEVKKNVGTKLALEFVTQAFTDLQAHFAKQSSRSLISRSEKYLTTPQAYRAFESPKETYLRYIKTYNEVLAKRLRDPNIKILNFSDFMREIKILLFKGSNEYPYTEAGFLKSRLAPITISGLAIEIADLKYENDEDKLKYFINSPNWEFYLTTCNNFGFMVDQHVPWRIVADLNSPVMRRYAARFNRINSAKRLIREVYTPVTQPSYAFFKNYMFELYKMTKKQGWTEAEYCDGKYVNKVVKPKVYTPDNFFKEFDLDYFLPIYMELRFMETEINLPEVEMKNLIHILHEQSKLRGVYYSLVLLERFLGKPFDYSGSLEYYKKKMEALIRNNNIMINENRSQSGGGY